MITPLVPALVGAIPWVLYDLELLALDNRSDNTWLGIVALSQVLGTGPSWSIIRRRLFGQADVGNVEE